MVSADSGSTPDPIPVPDTDAPWDVVWHFALSINGYEQCTGDLAELEQGVRSQWDRQSSLPDDLHRLRCALFFLQRSFRWNECDPVDDDERYVRAIVAQIRDLSGGLVAGPHDFEEWEGSLEGDG